MIRFDLPSAAMFLALVSAPAMLAQTHEVPDGMLRSSVATHGGRFDGLSIHDEISGRTLSMKEAFVLVMTDKTELRSSEMHVEPIHDTASVADPHLTLRRAGNAVAKTSACWQFTSTAPSVSFAWCINTRRGTDYLRELLRISAGNADLPIAEVRLLQFADPGAKVDGSVKGSPVVDANLFFGFEHPLSLNGVDGGVVRASLFRDLPLRAGQSITYSTVIGTSRPGQMRRAFLTYLETERPRAYEPFLHYNSWFDLGYENRFDEAGALDRVNEFGRHLVLERQVKLDAFLFDDGWDDPNTLWDFNSGFPNGFTKTGETAAKYNAGIGVWLSPWGGYAEQKRERIAYGRSHGFEIQKDGYALSGPKYFDRFEKICLEMVG